MSLSLGAEVKVVLTLTLPRACMDVWNARIDVFLSIVKIAVTKRENVEKGTSG